MTKLEFNIDSRSVFAVKFSLNKIYYRFIQSTTIVVILVPNLHVESVM